MGGGRRSVGPPGRIFLLVETAVYFPPLLLRPLPPIRYH
jgi:hypothetical protein